MELDPDARRILELTREARTPSAEDKLRVERLLSQSLRVAVLSGAAGASSAALAKPALAALAVKWTAIVAVPGLLIAGATALHRAQPAAPPPEVKVMVQPSPAITVSEPAPAPTAVNSVAVPSAPNEPTAAQGVTARSPKPRERLRAAAAPKDADSLNQELDLLHAAQAAWRRGDAAQALALLAQHRQRYPRSVLGPEREALRVHSLCAAGRTAEARDAARRAFPKGQRSPLRASVEQSCIKD